MDYLVTLSTTEQFNLDITYTMGMVQGPGDTSVWGVQDWTITHVDGVPTHLTTEGVCWWNNQVNEEDLHNAIMEWEA